MRNHNHTILVADDDLSILALMKDTFEEKGYRVEAVVDGLKALENFKSCKHDVAIVDIDMPGLDGVKLSQKIKEINPKTEVIIMTGYSTMESAIEALKLGIFDYFLKPINYLVYKVA